MKKAIKLIGKILAGMFAVVVVLLLGIFVWHNICKHKENRLFKNPPVGRFVEVDGHKMNIYVEGEGGHTLVFMPGSGSTSPIYDFRDFTDRLKDDYRIVIIEKFGYGFSDLTDDDRTVDVIAEQNRKALLAAGVEGPYILCPHSFAGLETIYWAQHYPDEVEAVIGLDMAVPESYEPGVYNAENIKKLVRSKKLTAAGRTLGIVRLLTGKDSFPETLTDEEKSYVKAIASARYCNRTYRNEIAHILDDLELLSSNPIPDVPTLLFISDGSQTTGPSWIEYEMNYASQVSNVRTVLIECKHAVYRYEPDRVEAEMREFLKGIE